MTARPASGRRTWLIAVSAFALGALLIWVARPWFAAQPVPPPLPVIDTRSLDPAVTRALTNALILAKTEPRSARAWGNLGLVLHANDYLREASAAYQYAQHLEPKNARWPYLRGMLLLPQASALELLRQAATLAPTEAITHLRLAQALTDHGHFEEAGREYANLLRHNPDNHLARLGQARLEIAMNKFSSATETLKPVLNDPQIGRESYALLAFALRGMDKPGAADAARQVAETFPPSPAWPDPYLSLVASHRLGEQHRAEEAKQLLEQGQLDKAKEIIDATLRDYPNSAESWLLLGRLQLKQKDCAGAQASAKRHLEIQPQSVNGYSQLGIALLCLERYSEAASALQQAVALKPDFGQAHFNLGFALARQGQGERAIPSFRNAIRCSPDFIDSYIVLADLLAQSGEKGDARQVLEQARALDPSDQRIEALARRLAER